MSWDEWAGSKPALARKVEDYACSIGKPYSEVLLTLLHESIVDVQALDSEVGFLAGMIMAYALTGGTGATARRGG